MGPLLAGVPTSGTDCPDSRDSHSLLCVVRRTIFPHLMGMSRWEVAKLLLLSLLLSTALTGAMAFLIMGAMYAGW